MPQDTLSSKPNPPGDHGGGAAAEAGCWAWRAEAKPICFPQHGATGPPPHRAGGGSLPTNPQEGGEKGHLLRPALWVSVSLFVFCKYHTMNTLCFVPIRERKPQVLFFKVKPMESQLQRGPSVLFTPHEQEATPSHGRLVDPAWPAASLAA